MTTTKLPGFVECNARFRLDLNDSKIWNENEFIKFLADNQGQAIDLEVPEGICLESIGVYALLDIFKFKDVTIRTFNIVEPKHPLYKIQSHILAFRYFDVPSTSDYSTYHRWTGEYTFGTFYNRPTWARLGLASYLHSRYKDKTLLNVRCNPANENERRNFELNRLFQVHPTSIDNFSAVSTQWPITVEPTDGYTIGNTTAGHTAQLMNYYPDLLVDVVAETFLTGRSFYPTEKTTRPMLMKKPFILMGSKNFLVHLRQMGFKTFYEFWDEDYDGYSPGQKYIKILELIDTLSVKTSQELNQMYNDMKPILDHNYNLLVEKKFITGVTYVE